MSYIVGELRMFAFDTAPEGFLVCQGQAVSRSTYSELFQKIGTRWGAGDGSTTFNVPEFRNQVPGGVSPSLAGFDDLNETITLGSATPSGIYARAVLICICYKQPRSATI
jgi:microcystin-dependent protein